MYIDAQTIITAASVLAAAGAILSIVFGIYRFFQKVGKQDEAIKAIKNEQSIIVEGLLACLKGLQEQGCDGPVTEAITKIDAHLNDVAHK